MLKADCQNAITKAASLLQPVRFDEGAKALGVAKMYCKLHLLFSLRMGPSLAL
jgi:hypothetical protein